MLTGEMRWAREQIVDLATAAGLRITSAVSGKTRVLVAADPDSLSGTGIRARELGIPVVHEDMFLRVVQAMLTAG